MPGPGRESQIRLYRDALSTPWGFRLYGGKDLRAPLSIHKIAAGSPVFGELQRDDVILEIQNCDATQMTHKQAQDLIRNAGGSLLLRIRRSGSHPESSMPAPAYEIAGPQRGFMLGRVKDTLTNVLDYSPTSGYGSNNNYYSPTSSYTSLDSTVPSGQPVKTWNLPKPAYKAQPSMAAGLMEPGWTPECMRHPRRQQGPPQPVLAPRPHQQYPGTVHSPTPPHANNEPPAWMGSLRPSVDARRSDERIGPRSASPEAGRYASAWTPAAPPGNNVVAAPEGVMNLQYNTPVGLYSKANVQEALTGQMGGVSLNAGGQPRDSDVYRLVKDDDRHKVPHRSTTTGYSHLHAAAATDDSSIRQSPSVRILEQRLAHPGATDGISDF